MSLNATSASTDVLRLELQEVAAGYQLRTQIRDNASVWASSSWVTITDDRHAVELAWSASATRKIDWWIDGVLQAATPTTNNSTRRVDLVRLGAVAGLDATTNGIYFLDAFESRRATAIGSAVGAAQAIAYAYDPLYRLTGATYDTGVLFGYHAGAVAEPLLEQDCLAATGAAIQDSKPRLRRTGETIQGLKPDVATDKTWRAHGSS